MGTKAKVVSLVIMTLVGAGCTSGSSPYRLIISHNFCSPEKDTPNLSKMDQNASINFYKSLAPLIDLDRASQDAPLPDDQKIKRPELQGKIVQDLREKCLLENSGDLGPDFENQTFKFRDKKVRGEKKAGVVCPVEIIETVQVDKEVPTLMVRKLPKIIRANKSHVTVDWSKKDPKYVLLGALATLNLKGIAETMWYQKLPAEETELGMQNVLLSVKEDYDLNTTTDNGDKVSGKLHVCRKLHEDLVSGDGRPAQNRYYATIVRFGLKNEKSSDKITAEGKIITVIKKVFDEKLKSWVTEKLLRNDFYINGFLLTEAEFKVLEDKRKEQVGFKPQAK